MHLLVQPRYGDFCRVQSASGSEARDPRRKDGSPGLCASPGDVVDLREPGRGVGHWMGRPDSAVVFEHHEPSTIDCLPLAGDDFFVVGS